MTNASPNIEKPELLAVTQEDRDGVMAALAAVGVFSNVCTRKALEAFARHRLDTRPTPAAVGGDVELREVLVAALGARLKLALVANPGADELADICLAALATRPAAIERVVGQREVGRLREALEPFANVARQIRPRAKDERWLESVLFYMGDDNDPSKWSLTGRAFDNALAALSAALSPDEGAPK